MTLNSNLIVKKRGIDIAVGNAETYFWENYVEKLPDWNPEDGSINSDKYDEDFFKWLKKTYGISAHSTVYNASVSYFFDKADSSEHEIMFILTHG